MTDAREVILKVLHAFNSDEYIDWERSDADLIIATLTAAGLVIVPKEPTERMSTVGWDCLSGDERFTPQLVWRAMVEASHGE